MDSLMGLELHHGVPMVSTLEIARRFDKLHKNVLRAVEALEMPEEFSRLNFEPSKYLDIRGKEQPQYHVTRDGFMLLVGRLTGTAPVLAQIEIITAFNKMEQFIRNNLVPDTAPLLDWGHARLEGKMARRNLTDAIRDHLIPAAIVAGSKNSGMLYMTYSKLINQEFIEDPDFNIPKGQTMRDRLSATDLALFGKAEDAMGRIIRDEIAIGTYYKAIYQKCKLLLQQTMSFLGKCELELVPKKPVPVLAAKKVKESPKLKEVTANP